MKRFLASALAFLAASSLAGANIIRNGHVSWPRTAPVVYNAAGSAKLVVVVSGEHNFAGNLTGNCTAVTYNGQALTLATKQLPVNPTPSGHGQTHSSIWYLDNPGNFSGPGTIAVTCVGTSWVATAIGLSGTLPGVGATAKAPGGASLGLSTSGYGSMVISALGMGGQGNTASPLPGITATAPPSAATLAGLTIGSGWAGHAVASAAVAYPSAQTVTFNTAKTDVVTIAAEFKAANPTVPTGPTPTVLDVVPGQSVQLTWNNLLPTTGTNVWVELWLGANPASLVQRFTADPDGLNRTTFLFEAPAPGVYHGRIDSFLDGAPTGTPHAGQAFSFQVSDEGLRMETWVGLRPLASVALLQQEGIALRPPDQSRRLVASAVANLPAPAGVRVRGLLTPTVTGTYTLQVAGSENATLWLSSDASRFQKRRVAWSLEPTSTTEWTKFPTQSSSPLTLQAGVSYYLEAQVMNASSIGHLALGWKGPGASTPVAIPSARLRYAPVDPDDLNDNHLPDAWETDTGLHLLTLPGARSEYGDPDKDGIANLEEYRLDTDPLDAEELGHGITREIWSSPGMGGASLTALTSSPRFYDLPSETRHAPGIDDALPGTQYAVRYRGFLVAPTTGAYQFWITGNDEVQLWLADGTVTPRGETQARTDRFGKRLIARNEAITTNIDWGTRNQFDRTPAQRSQSIHLVAGEVYYLEALHKQGWGDTDAHASVAWQPPGQARALIPATAFLGNSPHPADTTDDGLPDAWQLAKTLTAPTYTTVQRGQFGDPDGDGLTNLLEYQSGTNPLAADTDGDGFSDHQEIFFYGTDPLVSNTLAPLLAASPAPHQYSAFTGGWTANANGSLSAWDQRGAITYTFTLAEPGVHEITLTGAAIGDVRSVERLPIVLSLDAMGVFATGELVSNNGGQGTVSGITPWLAAGPHTLTILHDNYRTARRLRIDAIAIHRLGGADMDQSDNPDWIELNAAAENKLTRVPAQSRTSPASIEGITQNLPTATLTYTPPGASAALSLPLTESINRSFFTDVPLSADGPTVLAATFQNRLVEATGTIEWIPTNLFGTFTGNTLHLRQGDALRLDAFSGPAADGETFTVTLNGTALADETQNTSHTSGQPFVVPFTTAGTHTLTAAHDSQTATLTLIVHRADFGPSYSVRTNNVRAWSPPTLGAMAVVEADERLVFHETTGSSGPRQFDVNLREAALRHVIARLPDNIEGAPSAILTRGTVHGFHLAYLDQTDDSRIITRYPDGTWLMAASLIAVNLPADIQIRLRTHLQGTLFPDGSNIRWLSAADFNANGLATIYFEWAGSGQPEICNHLQIYVQP